MSRRTPSFVIRAPGKLNLYLRVLGKRADGYHELDTLMVSISLCDLLAFQSRADSEIHLHCRDIRPHPRADDLTQLPTGAQNLIVRAARGLQEFTGCSLGADVTLYKRIPLNAGLGGGSSDAAAALRGLVRLWGLHVSHADLHNLAAELGSDVPYFMSAASSAICRGRGELTQPVNIPRGLCVVVVRPHSGLSTKRVFERCRPDVLEWTSADLARALQQGSVKSAAAFLHNSLQAPAEDLNSDVRQLRWEFERQPVLGHMMSGSGTSYFGLCATRRHAMTVAARLKEKRLGDVFVAQCRP